MQKYYRLIALLLFCFAAQVFAGPPNIILILSDDVAQGDLGCYGQKLIQTPNLNRLAGEGTRYLQAYCGTTVCAPSRASLMTGQHCGHCPIRGNYEVPPEGQLPLPAETVTVAEVLKSASYATVCSGKWGMGFFDTTGSPMKQGFDHFFGYNCQREAHSYFPRYLYNDATKFFLDGNDGKTIGKTYAQDLIQSDTLQWIEDHHQQPFFLFYAITLPHGRHEIDQLGQYADKDWSLAQKSYAAQISRLDSDVGAIANLLKDLKIAENTLILFSGDNGSSFSSDSEIGKRFEQDANGLRGFKRDLYEGALRQAAFAWWPGTVPAGRVSDEPWAFWDFLPTCAELAGVGLADSNSVDGKSLVSFLKGGAAPKRDYFYWELHETNPIQAIRFGDWKAVKPHGESIELYNLADDQSEQLNIAQFHADLVTKAQNLMNESHQPNEHWPLTGSSAERNASGKAAWEATRFRAQSR